jgi:hypothetical protein
MTSPYARAAAGSGQTARMDRNGWRWKPHLKVMTVAVIAAGYVSLVLSLFGVWRTL